MKAMTTARTWLPTLQSIGLSAIGIGFLGLAQGKSALRGYSTPNRAANSDAARVDYLLDTYASLRRFLPPGLDLLGKDVLELSPGNSRGNGALFLAQGARSYHAIDMFPLASAERPAFYDTLLDGFADQARSAGDLARARMIAAADHPCFSYAVGADFDIPRLAGGRSFDVIVSCAAFEHYDDVPASVAGLSQVARPGCETAHIIDLQTHSRWIRDIDPNNIYRFPEPLYRRFGFEGQPNRLRPIDYERAFRATGWADVRFVADQVVAPERQASALAGLATPFGDAQMDMSVLTGALSGRLP